MAALSFPAGIRPYRVGDTGYAQYMAAFNRTNGGGGDGSGCGCLIAIAVVVVLVLIAIGS